MTLQMASSAKSLFGGPTKSKSCFSNVGFTQEHNPRKEESPLWNLKRRLSSEEQHERRLQADMETRDSLYAQRKAERAMMREQMRSKYHLPKSAQDQQQMKAAGSPVQLPKELRNMALPGESRPHKSSLWGFLHPPSLAPQRKSAHPKMASLVPGTNCQLM
ncbi:complexin-3 isoform X2 [Xenopus laevis]|nr:complexin-3 isoform X2 [Xenopus laevis]XP_041429795.1 complexin-3 isoform X2 [Xenopus laevis]